MNKRSTILVLGASGMLGQSIVEQLKPYKNVLIPTSKSLNLLNKDDICSYLAEEKPSYVFMAAAKVGGISANIKSPADFGYLNAAMGINVIDCCHKAKVKKLLYIGSSCIYPKNCIQPMREEHLLSGPFEPTNEMYAFSKAYCTRLCDSYNKQYGTNFISCQPCNLFGENDNFDLESSHLIAALIRKFHEAKINKKTEVTLWGSGNARREVMYVKDCAQICVNLMRLYNGKETINVGSGVDFSIKEIANKIKNVVKFDGDIKWDTSKPEGMMAKLLSIDRLNNFIDDQSFTTINPEGIDKGLKNTYNWFKTTGGKK